MFNISRKAQRKQSRIRRKKPKSWCIVYVLKAPQSDLPVYIGQTRCLPEVRLQWHLKNVYQKMQNYEKLSPVQRWISDLMGQAKRPAIEIIDKNGKWDISEAVWIDRYRQKGFNLLNRASLVD